MSHRSPLCITQSPLHLLLALAVGFSAIACDEEEKPAPQVEKKAPEPVAEEPVVKSPPHLLIDEGGPQVRGMTAVIQQENGTPNAPGIQKLRQYLNDEKEFLSEKDVEIQIERKTPQIFVTTFLTELAALNPSKITITTSTRSDYPSSIEFVPQEQLKTPEKCSLVGTITKDRGTAIWKLSGGTAHKRGKGMGGPDLSMTQETIERMAKKCDSDLFFVSGFEDVNWGLIFDLGGAGLSVEKAGLKRAVLPTSPVTAGRPLKL